MSAAAGCTPGECATASRLADALAKKYGLIGVESSGAWRVNFEERFSRAEARAAVRFAWEYRRCGKRNCHCSSGGRHGPYRYSKKRTGRKVVSVYHGR